MTGLHGMRLLRWGLTAAVLVAVWQETGWATTLALGLLAMRAELADWPTRPPV